MSDNCPVKALREAVESPATLPIDGGCMLSVVLSLDDARALLAMVDEYRELRAACVEATCTGWLRISNGVPEQAPDVMLEFIREQRAAKERR